MSNKKQIILMAESSDIYHDGRVLKEAHALTEAGYDICIYGFRNFNFVKPTYPFQIKTLPVFNKKNRLARNLSLIFNILIFNFRILFKRAKVYHSHNTMFLPSMFLASKIYGAKLIYDCHEVQWELNILARKIESAFIKKVKYIINVSEGRAKAQIERFDLKEDSLSIVSNFPEIPKRLTPISFTNKKQLIFIFSGGFDLYDNKLDNFVRALHDFKECRFILMVFGYGDSYAKMEKIIKDIKIEDRVQFIPLVKPNEVIRTIEKFDIAVNLLTNPRNLISYKYHGINKVYEYLLAGLPILSSNLPSFINEFEGNNIGKSVDPDNIESIKEGIQYFLDHRSELEEMKKRARALAISKFNWDSEKYKLVELYKNLCVE
ncbi:glycosyltransferase [Flavobacteriaceae bacterium]|nr:glycosyltransferase [Flavobacteriaceae bacterium]